MNLMDRELGSAMPSLMSTQPLSERTTNTLAENDYVIFRPAFHLMTAHTQKHVSKWSNTVIRVRGASNQPVNKATACSHPSQFHKRAELFCYQPAAKDQLSSRLPFPTGADFIMKGHRNLKDNYYAHISYI